jgi:hypothetical protein
VLIMVAVHISFSLMIQMVDKEIARKKELDKLLDFMCQQLELLKVIDRIPKDIKQLDVLINRALDVRSACMRFLALNIRHDATILGTPGTLFNYIKLILSQEKYSKHSPRAIESSTVLKSISNPLSTIIAELLTTSFTLASASTHTIYLKKVPLFFMTLNHIQYLMH